MKNVTKRLLVCLLLGAMLFGCFTACKNQETEQQTEETEEVDTNTDPKYLELKALLRGKLSEYQVVRSDSMKDADVKTVLSFRQSVVKASSEEIKVVTDFEFSYPRQDKEIVIGKTQIF